MKLSKFNRFIYAGESTLAFNCVSCGFAEMEPSTLEVLKALDSGSLSAEQQARLTELVPELQRGMFIVEDQTDEIPTLQVAHNARKYDTSTLSLTIAPTLACNFRCIYCFQGELPPLVMHAKVQQAILDFVSARINHLRQVDVCWYGGEPLLAANVIYSLSEQLLKTCNDHGCNYGASLITNGWLLSQETAEHLRECKVSLVQVTLDGLPEVHNARRPLKNGGATFDRIVENITAVTDLFDHLPLRINVDTTNADRVLELFEFLHDHQLLERVHPYLGRVFADAEACADFEPCCIESASFAKMEAELYKDLKQRGMSVRIPYPRFLTSFCSAVRFHSYVVDPLGRLYKCWNVIGKDDEAVGNLLHPEGLNARLVKWLALEPFDIAECHECDILPLCAGGCPYHYYRGEYERAGHPNCVSWRYHLDDLLLLWYKDWKENTAAEGEV